MQIIILKSGIGGWAYFIERMTVRNGLIEKINFRLLSF